VLADFFSNDSVLRGTTVMPEVLSVVRDSDLREDVYDDGVDTSLEQFPHAFVEHLDGVARQWAENVEARYIDPAAIEDDSVIRLPPAHRHPRIQFRTQAVRPAHLPRLQALPAYMEVVRLAQRARACTLRAVVERHLPSCSAVALTSDRVVLLSLEDRHIFFAGVRLGGGVDVVQYTPWDEVDVGRAVTLAAGCASFFTCPCI
jgi:hypothetical protein